LNIPIQSPLDLQFGCSFVQPVRQPLTRLVKHRLLSIPDIFVTFTIIGESHLVEISDRQGRLLFTEVLACVDLSCEQMDPIHLFTSGGKFSWQTSCYKVEVCFEPGWSNPDLSVNHLLYNFDHPLDSQSNRLPYTYISWQYHLEINRLDWKTIHVYPQSSDQVTSVVSHSVFEFK